MYKQYYDLTINMKLGDFCGLYLYPIITTVTGKSCWNSSLHERSVVYVKLE